MDSGNINVRLIKCQFRNSKILKNFITPLSNCKLHKIEYCACFIFHFLIYFSEPIAMNSSTVVCPFIDVIAYDTFEYRAQDEGARGTYLLNHIIFN